MTVPPGLRLRLYGQICGDLIVQKDGEASIYGSVSGVVQNQGAVRILGRAGCLQETAHAATVINDRAAMGPAPPPPMVKVRARLPEVAPPPAAKMLEKAPEIAGPAPARPRRPLPKKRKR